MSELTTIARPYAKAAFDFAVEQRSVDKSAVEKWGEMLGFLAEVVENDTMKDFLTSSFSAQKLADTVIAICGEQIDQYGQNLIRLMAENKRLTVLPAVFKEFQHYVEEYNAITEVQVTSAQPLSVAQQEKIAAAMEKKLARKIKLNCNIDNSLIAGVIIRTDDFVIDGSSRGQLTRLANELQL
ncbi:F0F1 ATP synthase subunit delta [Aggregatibacter actinomycetemcomitans]|uniref:F0F1 ATP synthase subunit delta n=1 Tax=Aggregatibacter actinomycetemcomitans TaxID=714 RepID=UPI00197B431E|nr:F0F1 ATP synthase subunit delta [Aggregatibacter actinomycetemcomitans]MBN6063382.1 F0F1 ATP synthase subunit delta [Aggregatibacter actinomycetemcomitans]MBN6066844.1 F0F1 ATP synthase subunit delta [Aggregatibacter actinomycetemcomitans]MBN6080830.1 F0F1 ATP synthase subunit delta [Aggregatibacter actinomycetemcomitans]MBN6083220.1 F0F1 ATP synthase subunit delta [Aggregatibacter actinomycetemcomitans]